ncbi:MAG: nuclear transport factor 2 family protein [Phycisphaerales bacterium]
MAAVAVCLSVQACGLRSGSLQAVEQTLDSFHRAAAAADMEGYVGRLAPDGVFLGTDASERWTRDEFRAFCEPYFARGQGWLYEPMERHVRISPDGRTAWFDEILTNESYGTLRGSGVLRRRGEVWEIEQYNLAFLVPNGRADEVVKVIRSGGHDTGSPP